VEGLGQFEIKKLIQLGDTIPNEVLPVEDGLDEPIAKLGALETDQLFKPLEAHSRLFDSVFFHFLPQTPVKSLSKPMDCGLAVLSHPTHTFCPKAE
jgi:hypothetical protein